MIFAIVARSPVRDSTELAFTYNLSTTLLRFIHALRPVNDGTEGGASWVLARKVAEMVWISVQFNSEEYEGCFLGASYYVAAAEGSTQEAPIIIYHQLEIYTNYTTFLGSTHGYFLGASFCDIINGS